ncbi:MAG: hypothetical protein GF364_14345, partial [Candidatus Lokiarchaeota archaeon]|nr:hypothetical protein [Candidatus Lokiarchaeota archaeon]
HYNCPTHIYGTVLSEEDILAKRYNFTDDTEEGDFVIVLNTGAYTHTFSNRFPYYRPKFYIIEDKTIQLISENY